MTKKLKGIILGVVVILLLVGAVVALKLTAPETEEVEETTTQTDTSSLIFDKNPSDVNSIRVTNSSESYDITKVSDESWTIVGYDDLPLNYTAIEGLVNECATLTTQQTLDNPSEDLSIYGLDDSATTLDITYTDGSTIQMKLGGDVPKGSQYYFMKNDDNSVYTVSTSDFTYAKYAKNDYITKVMYTKPEDSDTEDDYDPAKINSITVLRKDLEYPIVAEYDVRQDDDTIVTGNSSTHVLTQPVSLDLNPDKCDTFLNGEFGLTATSVAYVHPTDEQLKETGLDDPQCSVCFDINEGPFVMYFGYEATDDDGNSIGYYGYPVGVDVIYIFDKTSVPWAYVKPLDISNALIAGVYIYTIDTIDITTEDNTYQFTLNGDENDFKVSYNGSDFANVDLFKSFYQYLLRAPAEELYLEDTTDSPRVTVTVASKTGTQKIEFISTENRQTIVVLDGRTSFKMRTAYVDRLLENLENLINGDEIIETW